MRIITFKKVTTIIRPKSTKLTPLKSFLVMHVEKKESNESKTHQPTYLVSY
jgi:hypothetical protein